MKNISIILPSENMVVQKINISKKGIISFEIIDESIKIDKDDKNDKKEKKKFDDDKITLPSILDTSNKYEFDTESKKYILHILNDNTSELIADKLITNLDNNDYDNLDLELIIFLKYKENNDTKIKNILYRLKSMSKNYEKHKVELGITYNRLLNTFFRSIVFSIGYVNWSKQYRKLILNKLIYIFEDLYSNINLNNITSGKIINNISRRENEYTQQTTLEESDE